MENIVEKLVFVYVRFIARKVFTITFVMNLFSCAAVAYVSPAPNPSMHHFYRSYSYSLTLSLSRPLFSLSSFVNMHVLLLICLFIPFYVHWSSFTFVTSTHRNINIYTINTSFSQLRLVTESMRCHLLHAQRIVTVNRWCFFHPLSFSFSLRVCSCSLLKKNSESLDSRHSFNKNEWNIRNTETIPKLIPFL